MEENSVVNSLNTELDNILSDSSPADIARGRTLEEAEAEAIAAEKIVADWKVRIAQARAKFLGVSQKAQRLRFEANHMDKLIRNERAKQRLAVAMEREVRAKAKYEAKKPRMYDMLAEAVRADIKERRADFERRHNQTGGGIGFGNDFYIYNDVEVTDELVNEAIDKMDDKQLERISKTVNKV